MATKYTNKKTHTYVPLAAALHTYIQFNCVFVFFFIVLCFKYVLIGVEREKVHVYFHYMPQYFHLHIHFSVKLRGTSVNKTRFLKRVIADLKCNDNYYQNASIPIVLRSEHTLCKQIDEYVCECLINCIFLLGLFVCRIE